MVAQTLIAALAVAQKKDAEERARREAKDDFKGRFRMVFGKPADGREEAPAGNTAKPPPDETIWEDDGDAPPERLPDSANVDDAAGKPPPEEPPPPPEEPPQPPEEPPPPPAPKPTPKPGKPAKRTGAAKRTAKGKERKK